MEERRFEKTSSASVDTNKKGESSFSVKVYFDPEERTPEEVADKIKFIMDELKKRF